MRRAALVAAASLAAGFALPAGAGAATARVVSDPVEAGVAPTLRLHYDGAPGETNQVAFASRTGETGGVEIRDSGAAIAAGAGCERLDDHAVACSPGRLPSLAQPAATEFGGIEVRLGDRSDTARGEVDVPFLLIGGTGNDELRGGPALDVLRGGAGEDTLRGGAGTDIFQEDETTADDIDGGPNHDQLDYGRHRRAVNVDLGRGRGADGDRIRSVENVLGGRSADRIAGGAGSNTLAGGGGNDVLIGRSGADKLIGDAGQDTLSGGAGPDRLDVLDGSRAPQGDRARCGAGADVVLDAAAADRLSTDCEHVLLEGRRPEVFAVSVSQPLRAQRSGVVEVHLAVPASANTFRGRVALRFRGVLLGPPSSMIELARARRATARVDLVGPALTRLVASRRLSVEVGVNDAAFTTVLRAPLTPPTGTGGTPA